METKEQTQSSSFQKNDTAEVTIEDIGQDGEGIGHVNGYTLFIKDAVIGDTVEAKIMKVKKGYAFAKLLKIVKPSPFRVAPRCEIADKCGGCQIQALRYDQQLAYKERKVRNDLIRIGGFSAEEIAAKLHPIVGMEDPWHYRNKAQLPVGSDRNGSPVAGFYAGRTHVIVPVSSCWIGAEINQKIISVILDWMKQFHIAPYDEQTGTGLIRHILIRSGAYSGQIMVCLVANLSEPSDGQGALTDKAPVTEQLPHEAELVELLSVIPGMTSICLNINTEKTNVVLGQRTRTIWGTGTIEDSLHIYTVTYTAGGHNPEKRSAEASSAALPVGAESGSREGKRQEAAGQRAVFQPTEYPAVRYNISPRSFYQVNPRQTEKLYSLVLHYAQLTGREIVWDLYCGVGTISLFLARFAKEVYGVEVIPEAVRDAKRNAQLNGIDNALFQTGKVEDVLPAFVERNARLRDEARVDVVVVDPPRKGCDPKCLDTILAVKPAKVIYVSCDPATLSRDLKILTAGGYRIEEIQPVDQFGHSVHVETVVSMKL